MARRVAGGLSAERLRELAQAGAEAALKRLRAEIIAIERTWIAGIDRSHPASLPAVVALLVAVRFLLH